MCIVRSCGRIIAMAGLAALCAAVAAPARSAAPLTIAVADFDYTDTSGEVNDQAAAHRARVAQFADLVRENLSARGDYQVLPLDCPEHPCTPINMRPDDFIAAARRSGARFVVYGGIRKMSTLVQWGDFELLDLQGEKLLLQRTVSFRGDNDEAFRRAAAFVGDTLREAMPKP
ncbi:DUF2380 domain-containing protein [Bradyrhizobium sp.]|uniref:DUF2380 domain-containing protein n=1 Tax=Bradyrhizobium sp. TaxID=376 RepID=UPI001DF1A818|nr:DUF2380 domain-containing protein [Bradyrhizobium sp.]MBV8700041.1 DUF2380 domain-containing protein [Bradyrhizobium sp.]MBV8916690.1 DUF2380 domain-containing protein [Bradyrhizobium sp.]MBV9983384.1 DUF2380 domain-containing protein [Bradyrhizobium sp.]